MTGGMVYTDRVITIIEAQFKGAAQINQANKAIAQVQASAKGSSMAMLSLGFTMLFTGMAVKRLGESILTSLVKTYMTATDEQNKFHQQLMAVQASFEFLKFSIMDALANTDYVIAFIDMLISVVNVTSLFVSKHPEISLILGVFLAMSIVLGSIAMVLGQIQLATVGLGIGLWPLLGIIILISAEVALLTSLFTTDMRKANPVITGIKIALIAVGIILLALLSPVVGLIGFFVVVGVMVAKLWSDFGDFGNFFKAVFRGIIMVVGIFSQAIVSSIIVPLQWIALGLLKLIELKDKLSGTTTDTSGLQHFISWKPDLMETASSLANSIEFDETKGRLFQDNSINVTVNGDVGGEELMSKLEQKVKGIQEESNNRFNGTTQRA